ncbi:MAG: hypothetical protein ACT4ON_01210 [Bacteroidota bacterium]
MLVIFGKKNKIIEAYEDLDSVCENCDSKSIFYFVYLDYYHIFWIPIFPVLKYGGMHCDNCGKSHVNVINAKSSEYEKQTRTPIYMYTITIFFLLIVSSAIIKAVF